MRSDRGLYSSSGRRWPIAPSTPGRGKLRPVSETDPGAPSSPVGILPATTHGSDRAPIPNGLADAGLRPGNRAVRPVPVATTPPLVIGEVGDFTHKARLGPFVPVRIPPCVKPDDYNDDLAHGSFTHSLYAWAGEQRKGILCHIADSVSISDQAVKEVGLEFFMDKEVPLHVEIRAPTKFIATVERDQAPSLLGGPTTQGSPDLRGRGTARTIMGRL